MISWLPSFKKYKKWSVLALSLSIFSLLLIFAFFYAPARKIISPYIGYLNPLKPLEEVKKGRYEVFGFAPYWTINKLENVDFTTLTTLAYFGVSVDGDGNLVEDDQGYRIFMSEKTTKLFKKAHSYNTAVVLTLTQMDNDHIEAFLVSKKSQQRVITQAVDTVKRRGIDGINVDFEYVGDPGLTNRNAFTEFVANLTKKMHEETPGSRVTVSVYALSARKPKLYNVGHLARHADGIFMMAYDFSVRGAEKVMPTAPLYGREEGKYPYDVASSVEDFLRVMPANKLILGVPYYGYDYLVYEPGVKADTRPSWTWRGEARASTYEYTNNHVVADKEGWDDIAKVGWKAYYVSETDTWRMIFLDDERSLRHKYDFAKNKDLMGVGMWALGFDNGETKLWSLLREQFGAKLADSTISQRPIN